MTSEDFYLVWFPPDASQRERSFKSEAAARRFLDTGKGVGLYEAREWNPILSRRVTTVTEETIPL